MTDEDGGPTALSRNGLPGIGCLFLGHRGQGAYKAPYKGTSGLQGLQRIGVRDFSHGFAEARFMESWESRHSDHSFTAAVVSGVLRAGVL